MLKMVTLLEIAYSIDGEERIKATGFDKFREQHIYIDEIQRFCLSHWRRN